MGTAVVLTGNALTTHIFDRGDVQRLVRNAVRFTVVVEFLLTLYVMPLGAELVLVPLVGLLLMARVVAERDPKLAKVRTLLDRTLMLLGFGLMTWASVRSSTELHGPLTRENAKRLLLPPAFTVAFVPALYGMWRWSRWDRDRSIRRWREEKLAA